ncbi:potassium-transporting ATPase subunit KdpA [Streptomyces sp. XY332]|uniref:potassium-transporting ATPase subunit KdpA n=1 Tax=Streptomyces sp. XY332 TaxID=1415561 RepID=UPI0006B1BDA7|nr:potassium-transporting ATPase subunit KdpA [Streptomyces sp. XY332]KOY56054.1 hypothetical protein ADK59_21270 [Streptomyces sp. XY332]
MTNHDTTGPNETVAVEPFLPDQTLSAGLPAQAPSVPTPTSECEPELPKPHLSKPSVARVCDFITGGTHNYSADRALGRPLLTAAPWMDRAATAARNHGQETVARLAAQGITQFLDLGGGLPQRHGRNTHDAAQRHRPESTVVYVDRDPMVQAHVRTWLAETPREQDLHADITRTAHLLHQPATARLDRARPVAVLLHEALPWISDAKAQHLLETLRNWLPAGSVLFHPDGLHPHVRTADRQSQAELDPPRGARHPLRPAARGRLAQSAHTGMVTEAVGGQYEGTETRFGIPGSTLFGVSATASADGAANSSYDSFSSLCGGVLLAAMMLGEIAPGGTGSGLYGLIVVVLVAVFIGGLMVGRTPEYLRKRIGCAEMRRVVVYALIPPTVILACSAIALATGNAQSSMGNTGAHGLTSAPSPTG